VIGATSLDGAIRVVLAEDSADVRALVREVLDANPDIQVVAEAGDGAQALAVIQVACPHVLVCDVSMPVMDGLETLREVRRRYGRALPVIMLSGYGAESSEDAALGLGASAYVEKSGDLTPLLTAIRAACTDPRNGSAARAVAPGAGAPWRAPLISAGRALRPARVSPTGRQWHRIVARPSGGGSEQAASRVSGSDPVEAPPGDGLGLAGRGRAEGR
jgi:CheY-like chemotaxis protein